MRRTKKACQTIHAKKRALERYGVELSTHDIKNMVDIIKKGQATFLEKQSDRISVFEVAYLDKAFKVCYDRKRKSIATCLPEDFEAAK